MQEAMRLRDSGHGFAEELTDRLADMKTQIRGWEDGFGVESPNQLRGTLADESLDADEETDRRREIARGGSTFNGVCRSLALPSANGTFSRRQQSLLRPAANGCQVASGW